MKKLFSKEVKIGLAFILAFVCVVFGVNFLKGINIFTPSNHYYAQFDTLEGLTVSNAVYVKGYKVGQVRAIEYDFTKKNPFIIDLLVNDDIKLPRGSKIVLKDDGLLGGKVIELVYASSPSFFKSGDTIASEIQPGVMAQIVEFVPKLEQTFEQVDSVLNSVNTLVSSPEIKKSLGSIEKMTADLEVTSAELKKMMTHQVPLILSDVNLITTDLKKVSGELSQVEFAPLFARVNNTINNLQLFSEKLNSTDGTLGLLINDKSLYGNLNATVSSANSLVVDIKANPKRYVHFSVFGKKEKKSEKESSK